MKLPQKFQEQYSNRGDSFFEVAKLLYSNHSRHFTQSELAEAVGISNTRISNFTKQMVEDEWVARYEDQTTFVWNVDSRHPAETDTTLAISEFYFDLRDVILKHAKTTPGAYAIIGSAFFVTAVVALVMYLGTIANISEESTIPSDIFLVIAIVSLLVGVVITLLAPILAWLNRGVYWILHR